MSQTREVDQTASDSEVALNIGDQLQITLPETRTAGYQWQVTSPATPIYSIQDNGFTPARGVGGTGSHRWTLTARRTGSAAFAMDYGRPWGSASPAQQFKLTITVGK